PELLCGLHRRSGEGPTLYPVACSPQAWSAGAAFMLLKATLGLSIDCGRRAVVFDKPKLPKSANWLRIDGFTLGDAKGDLLLERVNGQTHIEIETQVDQLDVTVYERHVP